MKKRVLLTMVVVALVVATVCSFAACSKETKIKPVKSQIEALTEVKALTSDAAIIDATMGGYLLKEDGSFKDLQIVEVEGVDFEKEYYAVAAKKGNTDLIAFVNEGIKKAQKSDVYDNLLAKYGLSLRKNLIEDKTYSTGDAWKNSLKANEEGVKEVVIGYTVNAPMGIVNKDNTVTGFDIELANFVFKDTGVVVKTKLIEWSNKEVELESGTVDLVWNGLTSTPERQEKMCLSEFYMDNAQALIVPKKIADKIKSIDDLKGMQIAVEAGSAGEENAEKILAKLAAK